MISKSIGRRLLQAGLAALSLALLVSCGGGKREAFKPGHIYVFGDEFSSMDSSGSTPTLVRYTVNQVVPNSTPTAYDPNVYPSWVAFIAAVYGKFSTPVDCVATSADSLGICAEPGADVNAVISKINTKSFQKNELVVIMAGTRDILNAYQNFKLGGSIDTLAATVKNSGIALGQKINVITDTGARVAVATIPDIGLSPYAISEAGGAGNLRNYGQAMDCSSDYRPNPGEYSKALSYLTACFNNGLRGINGIKNDGKKIALISTFDWTILVARSPSTYGIADPFNPACPTSVIPHATNAQYSSPGDCNTTASGVVSAPLSYLWGFGPWFGPGGHALLGQRAISQLNLNWGE